MKKLLLLLIFAFAVSAMQAQNNDLYSFWYRDRVASDVLLDFMQQRDGNIIADFFVQENNGDYTYTPIGGLFYKISPTTLTVIDSLFVTDTVLDCLIARDPQSEGNIRAHLEYHEDCNSTFLHIRHFTDDDLHTNPEEDIITLLCEGHVDDGFYGMVDCNGDLIITYYKENGSLFDIHMARFGSDGTLKHQALVHESNVHGVSKLQLLKESPLKYYQSGMVDTYSQGYHNLAVYVIDSLFNKSPIIISSLLSEEAIDPYNSVYEHLHIDGFTKVIPVGEDNIMVATKYEKDTTSHPMTTEYGVVVAKYDIRTMQPKGYIVFNDYPGYYHEANCLGINMMKDGAVYFLYKEVGYPTESVVIVKMDTNLNVEWKRICKTDKINIGIFSYSFLYKDEMGEDKGIAWIGTGRNTNTNNSGWALFLLNHDGTEGINESGIEVRPYAYYPNPARDQLHMEFSPDVQPAQVELYDLQGRLVRTQSKAFESIDMSQLPAGTYTMRVIMENGMAYSDKVVKE